MKDETIKAVTAQVSIAALAGLALILGYNGTILGFALGALANLGGYFSAKKTEE